MSVQLWALGGERRALVNALATDPDGRALLLSGDALRVGVYELVFAAGDYLRLTHDLPEPAFLDEVVIRFGVFDAAQTYHVPLLLSPYGYSTYRGS